MKISKEQIVKYAAGLVHHLGPTIILGIVALVGFGVLSARLESKQKELYAFTQNEVAKFRPIVDGIAQAKTQVIEKREIKTIVKELPPEVRAELKRLNAKVEALLKAQITVPAVTGSGNATHSEPLRWTFNKPGVVAVGFTIESPEQGALLRELAALGGSFDYTIAPIPIGLTITKGVYRQDGVDGLQQWYIMAQDNRDGSPLAVKNFDVKIPNLYKKTHWWQKWWITIPAGFMVGAVATK